MKLKKGDEVVISTGKDKGKKGKIEKISLKNDTVFLPGLNIRKKHLKKRDEQNPGGIIEFAKPLPVSNVALICPKCSKATRIGFAVENKKKIRICKKCDSTV